ncbi:mycothiol synthase [Brevibacterium sp. 91QC2O2]|uniref:mycothiol synthase n=1 Tax=Brevibacterium sp. 91QC2O2 TaxID=2968458 RepID=UPI00211B99A3|nr:mycothiol synthase [Brevibacterium sp. 91QC2O2]MCQ9368919.1 mycothiol synthase [Brevibacterium sp. 91QC2O2]
MRIEETGLTEEVGSLLSTAAAADGIAPISDGLLSAAAAPESVTLGLRDDAGSLIGWAVAAPQGERGAAELVIAPAARGAGAGTRLVAALLEHLAAVPDAVDSTWFWSHGDHPGARRLAATRGYRRERELLQLHTGDLAELEIPAPQIPTGVEIRTFRPGDEADWRAVNNRAFDWHPEQGRQSAESYAARVAEPDFDPADVFFAVASAGERAGRIIGFHETKLHTDSPLAERVGEVYVIGVDPDAGAHGVGRALTLAGMAHLRDRGADLIELYVESDNDRALRLYESLGFGHRIVHASYAPPAAPTAPTM